MFIATDAKIIEEKPESFCNLLDNFNYYAQQINQVYGTYGALKFICVIIVISVLLSNVFKYLSQRIMENLRIHTLLNIRKAVFENVMDMHLGFLTAKEKEISSQK